MPKLLDFSTLATVLHEALNSHPRELNLYFLTKYSAAPVFWGWNKVL